MRERPASDIEEVTEVVRRTAAEVAVRALVVPGSEEVRDAMVAAGYDAVFTDAGFDFASRAARCASG